MARYQMKQEGPDPFDIMCDDCKVNYIEWWEDVTEDELKAIHEEDLATQSMLTEDEKQMHGWQDIDPSFDGWVDHLMSQGYLREV